MQQNPIIIIKIGGNVVDNPTVLSQFLDDFAAIRSPKILIHGGGKVADALLKKLDILPLKIEGRRVTDADTLDVVTMVYAGLINKKIVAALQARSCNAVGFCGADMNLIQAHKRLHAIDYGFVGDIDIVNTPAIEALMKIADTLVIAPITHDRNGQLLNTNADTIASVMAVHLSTLFNVTLKFIFEKKGVLSNINDEDSVIPEITFDTFQKGKADGTFFEGMIPKLDNAFAAMKAGVSSIVICGTEGVNSAIGTKLRLT